MEIATSRRQLFVMLGLLIAGCRPHQAPVEEKRQNDPPSAMVTLIVDGMI